MWSTEMQAGLFRHLQTRVCTPVRTHVFSLAVSAERAEKRWHPSSSQPRPGSRSRFLTGFSSKRNQGSLEEWLILGGEHPREPAASCHDRK